jgi:PAS domain S-box-containing protein
VLRKFLDPLMGDAYPLVTLFGAVAAAVWAGGYRSAIVVTILGYLVCAYLFIPTRGAVTFEIPNIVGLIAYLFTCSLIIGIGEAMRFARHRAAERGEILRVTLASIGDAVMTTDIEGRVTYMNAVAESLTGWTAREAKGQALENVFRIISEEGRQILESPVIRALREGAVVGLANHTILIGKDGVERPIDDSVAPIKDEHGGTSGCVLIFRDVSERRRWERYEADRLLSARLLASIVESSDDAIISKSLDGMIRSWNAAAERLFGYPADEAIGRHITMIIPPERIAEEDHIIASLKAGRRVEHFETERVRRDGERILVALTISPVKNDEGIVVGASKIVRDVTQRRQLEDHLRKMAADLSEVDRRKNEFLATLAHELRNPLAPLSSMLEILKRTCGDGEVVTQAVETMERQLGQLVRLVDDLLDLNRITHNRLELRMGSIELVSIVRQAVQACQPIAASSGHDLQLHAPRDTIHLQGDPVRLSQVFGNLLSNSCKYTDPGGTISVTIERRGANAFVIVRDNGSGIPSDKLQSIFEMFRQIDRPLEKSQGGLGIGLTLVKRLVEMHSGSIEARSAGEGHGSEFVVQLPTGARSPEAEIAEPSAGAEPTRPRRILVIDDNRDAASSLTLLLQISGNEVYMAHDGASGLKAIEKHRPEVVFLDIGLPGMSGYEVCRRLRESPWGKKILVVALTGWGQEEDRRKSQEAGFDGHLVKPVDYAVLVRLLDSLSDGRDSRSLAS